MLRCGSGGRLVFALALSACAADAEGEGSPTGGIDGDPGTSGAGDGSGGTDDGSDGGGGGDGDGGGDDGDGTADDTGADGGSTGDAGSDTGDDGDPGGSASPGCGQPPPGSPPSSVMVGGETRTFIVDVPAGYSEQIAYPLIFGWHGTGHQGANAKQQMRLLEAAGGQAIVVYPNGSAGAPVWQFPGGAGVTSPQRDLSFFDEMVAALGDLYCINGDRIFSTGFSQGAFFSNALGCERPWAVRGIAPVGGGGPWSCNPVAMSAMVIIGTTDYVSGEGNSYGYGNSAQRSRDFWLEGSGCGTSTTPVAPSPCVAYDCPGDTPVHFCEFVGGHQWWSQASTGMVEFFFAL